MSPSSTAPSRSSRFSVIWGSLLLGTSALLGLAVLAFPWRWDWIESSLERELRARIESSAPGFRVEKIRVNAKLEDLLRKEIPELILQLRHASGWSVSLAGPVQLQKSSAQEGSWQLAASAETRIETPHPLRLEFLAKLTLRLDPHYRPLDAALTLTTPDKVPLAAQLHEHQLRITSPVVEAKWNPHAAKIKLSWLKAEYLQSSERTVQMSRTEIAAHIPLPIAGPQKALTPGLNADFRSEGIEALWDNRYLDLPLGKVPLRIELKTPRSLDIQAGTQQQGQATLEFATDIKTTAEPLQVRSFALHGAKLHDFESLLKPFRAWPELAALSDWEFRNGEVAGNFKLEWPSEKEAPPILTGGRIRIEHLDLKSRRYQFAAAGVSAEFPLSHPKPAGDEVKFGLSRFAWRDLRGSLAQSTLTLRPLPSKLIGTLNLADKLKFEPLAQIRTPILGEVRFELQNSRSWSIETALDLHGLDLRDLAHRACATSDGPAAVRLPDMKLTLQFPKISLTPDSFDFTGEARLDLFNGALRIGELAVFDPFSSVPETQFESSWKNLDLNEIGTFIGLGKIDGLLEGYAKEVVLQGSLPTQFDFLLETRAHHRSTVYFSTDALHNLVRALTDTQNLPGIANWMAFGWPSRILGGYDLEFAGIRMNSDEGTIRIESLTPPAILKKENGRHFILYSSRFTMPLKSRQYPVLVDAPAMANFLARVRQQLKNLAESQAAENARTGKSPDQPHTEPPHNEHPPFLSAEATERCYPNYP